MRDPSPRAPFDQGLFLVHFNKGKALYDERRYEDAERELEEAYLLRPRDQKVLNLLGLVYFKQEKFDKAEEVYRKLVAESPEAHTLFYNLGLIHFKLGRLEEAENTFLKALELSKDNPKINFYLGSIYERQHRFQDAIYQYRQAGANLMVRRVEDKIAAGGPGGGSTVPPAGGPGPSSGDTQPPARRPRLAGGKKTDDTAEFKVQEVQAGLREMEGKSVQPVSGALMAEGAPGRVPSDTARFRANDQTIPPGRPDVITFPPRGGGDRGETLPPRRSEVFRFLENNLMEVEFAGKVYIKQGTIYSYSGNLTFWVKDPRPGGQAALVIITGNGRLLLRDQKREITFMHVQDETVYVEPNHLLACEDTLTPRYMPIGATTEVLALEGRGMAALSVASKPLTLAVQPDMPVSVPAKAVITWSGAINARLVEDPQLYQVLATGSQEADRLVRLEGTGRVLVEQSAG
jgi:uncharacterized protein (AIM24 family)